MMPPVGRFSVTPTKQTNRAKNSSALLLTTATAQEEDEEEESHEILPPLHNTTELWGNPISKVEWDQALLHRDFELRGSTKPGHKDSNLTRMPTRMDLDRFDHMPGEKAGKRLAPQYPGMVKEYMKHTSHIPRQHPVGKPPTTPKRSLTAKSPASKRQKTAAKSTEETKENTTTQEQ
jgi:hypothetical protein